MRGRASGFAALALLLMLLGGCAPNAREPDGLALARVMGVSGRQPVTLTAVCEESEDGTGALRGTACGVDFQAAREALPWTGEKELALSSLSYYIVDWDTDLKEAMRTILDDPELSPGGSVWLAEDPSALLEECDDPAGRLAVLEEEGVKAPTAVEVLAALETEGQVTLPQLVWDGERLSKAGSVRWEELE